MEPILLDKWALIFLAWPEWVPFYYLDVVKSLAEKRGIILSPQITASLRWDLSMALELSEGYARAEGQGSVDGFLKFVERRQIDLKWRGYYSRCFGLVRLIDLFVIARGGRGPRGEFIACTQFLLGLYEQVVSLDNATQKLTSPKVDDIETCVKPGPCRTRTIHTAFVNSSLFKDLQEKARTFVRDDVFPRLVRLCCASKERQGMACSPSVVLGSYETMATFLRDELPGIQRLEKDKDPLLRAISVWVMERKYLLRTTKRLTNAATAITSAPRSECFCRDWNALLFLALIKMKDWAQSNEAHDFQGANRFLSFDRLLQFLGHKYVAKGKKQWGIKPQGEHRIQSAVKVSIDSSVGEHHQGITKDISKPTHGVLIKWDDDLVRLQFCGSMWQLDGLGRRGGQFTPFSYVDKAEETVFRAIYDLCEDGLEPLYMYD